jgi:hypothetical protein
MTALVHTVKTRTPARAYCGMWIVDCELCRNAERLDRFTPAVMCTYCGVHIEVLWPPEDMVHSIERLLLMRPIPYTQNWNPDETLHDLAWENGEHGIFSLPDEIQLSLGSNPLVIEDTKIRTDKLPVTRRREFPAIGG